MKEMRPYALADFIAMKRGTFVGGFMHIGNSWCIGPKWLFQAGDVYPRHRSVYFAHPIAEYHVRWRQRLQDFSRQISNSKFYRPPVESAEEDWKQTKNTIKIGFNVTKPLGIYLGHVLRSNGITLINILSEDGFDIWI